MKLAKLLRWSLVGLGVLVGCAVIAIAIYLWRSSLPSDAARRLLAVYAARPAVPAAENSYTYLWGFGAPAGVDPIEFGRARIAWLQAHSRDPQIRTPDPGAKEERAASMRSAAMRALRDACSSGAATPCTLAFDRQVSSDEMTATEERQLARYRELLKYPRYFEIIPFDANAPLIPFDHALEGQQLLFIELARRAERGEADQIATELERDCDYWREVQRGADTLISRLIANVALRRHFFFGNRILRRLPTESVERAIPASWRRAFSRDELSMLRTFAGEYEYATRAVRRDAAAALASVDDEPGDDEEEPDFTDRIATRIGHFMSSSQHSLNRIADAYLRAAQEFQAPLDQYAAIDARLARDDAYFRTQSIGGYVVRAATSEGLRRAALLAAELRARGLRPDAVAQAVAASDLVDPFTLAPFTVDTRSSTLTFNSPQANARNRIQIFLY